jgi:hypothetical protein
LAKKRVSLRQLFSELRTETRVGVRVVSVPAVRVQPRLESHSVSITFHENPSSCSGVVICGQTHVAKALGEFWQNVCRERAKNK